MAKFYILHEIPLSEAQKKALAAGHLLESLGIPVPLAG